jgi:hypothetical protein
MNTKTCTKCHIDKGLDSFGIAKKGKYGRRSVCRACRSQHEKQDPAYRRKHYQRNRERIKKWKRAYYAQNNDQLTLKRRQYYHENKAAQNDYMKQYLKKRRQQDPKFRLNKNISAGVWRALRQGKKGNWESLVGYDTDQLMNHLESQFQPGMTWDNYGEWHIDHIRPISSFEYCSHEDKEFRDCWSLHNLQPLWAHDNLQKGALLE